MQQHQRAVGLSRGSVACAHARDTGCASAIRMRATVLCKEAFSLGHRQCAGVEFCFAFLFLFLFFFFCLGFCLVLS